MDKRICFCSSSFHWRGFWSAASCLGDDRVHGSSVTKHALVPSRGRAFHRNTIVRLAAVALLFLNCEFAAADTAADPLSGLRRVYAGVLLFQHFHSACDQVRPENVGIHQAAYESFARKHSVFRIEKFFALTPNPVPELPGVKAVIDKKARSITAHITARPETCSVLGQVLESLVTEKMGSPGITDLGAYFDSLLAQARLSTAQAPSAAPRAPSDDTASATGRIENLQDVYEAAFAVPTFQEICDQIVPAQAPVHKAIVDTFATRHSLPRIQAHFVGSKVEFAWIAASQKKLELGLAKVRAKLEEKPKLCSVLMLVLENLVEKKGGVSDLGALFDKLVSGDATDGLPEVATAPTRDDNVAATQTVRLTPPISIETVDGAPPQPGQVIYAETPRYRHSSLTLSGYYDDEVRYLDTAAVDRQGPVIKLDDTTFYYVAPPKDDMTIEGVFKSSSGYVGPGISVLKTKTLVFARNGRYSTSSSSGVIGGVLSAASSTAGEGSYRISRYTIELRPDSGPIRKLAFFPYIAKTFWSDSDAVDSEFDLLNIGGKVLYRDDG